jgi:hypothetical protein
LQKAAPRRLLKENDTFRKRCSILEDLVKDFISDIFLTLGGFSAEVIFASGDFWAATVSEPNKQRSP